MTSTSLSPKAISSLLAGPAGTPPPGVVPDFQHPPNKQLEGRVLMLVGLIIMMVPLIMRLFTQWVIQRACVIEDFLIISAAALTIALFAGEYVGLSPGHTSGFHMWDVTLADFYQSQKLVNINEILYPPTVTLVKMAILVQIRRVFAPTRWSKPWLWAGCWIGMITTPVFYFIIMFLNIFECWPRQKIWHPFTPGHCFGFATAQFLATSVFNVVSDILILLLPLPTIYMLHVNIRKKLMIGGVFATGGLACVVSILRLYYSFVVVNQPDVSWNYLSVGITALYEDVIGIIVFCLPVTPKFISYVQKTLRRDGYGRQDSDIEGLQRPCGSFQRPKTSRQRGLDSSLGVSSIRQYLGMRSLKNSHDSISANMESGTDGHNSLVNGINLTKLEASGSDGH